MLVMLHLVRTIVFDIFQTLNSMCKSSVFLLPAIFTLGNARVHVCSIDNGDVDSHIEASID